jgi:phosphatidylinositol 4-kinase
MLAMELIRKTAEIWSDAGLSLYLRPYDILAIGQNSGFVEFVPNSVSLHSVIKETNLPLLQFFEATFGDTFIEA